MKEHHGRSKIEKCDGCGQVKECDIDYDHNVEDYRMFCDHCHDMSRFLQRGKKLRHLKITGMIGDG